MEVPSLVYVVDPGRSAILARMVLVLRQEKTGRVRLPTGLVSSCTVVQFGRQNDDEEGVAEDGSPIPPLDVEAELRALPHPWVRGVLPWYDEWSLDSLYALLRRSIRPFPAEGVNHVVSGAFAYPVRTQRPRILRMAHGAMLASLATYEVDEEDASDHVSLVPHVLRVQPAHSDADRTTLTDVVLQLLRTRYADVPSFSDPPQFHRRPDATIDETLWDLVLTAPLRTYNLTNQSRRTLRQMR